MHREPKVVEFIDASNSLNKEKMPLSAFLVTFSNHVPFNRKVFIFGLDEEGNLQISLWIFKG